MKTAITITIAIETKNGSVIPVATFCCERKSISLLRRGADTTEYSELEYIPALNLDEALAIVGRIYGNGRVPAKAVALANDEERKPFMKPSPLTMYGRWAIGWIQPISTIPSLKTTSVQPWAHFTSNIQKYTDSQRATPLSLMLASYLWPATAD